MKTYELIGEVDEQNHVFINATVPADFSPGKVRITFTPVESETEEVQDDWQKLSDLIQTCQADAGIADLAHEHEHYRLGTPKKNDYEAKL